MISGEDWVYIWEEGKGFAWFLPYVHLFIYYDFCNLTSTDPFRQSLPCSLETPFFVCSAGSLCENMFAMHNTFGLLTQYTQLGMAFRRGQNQCSWKSFLNGGGLFDPGNSVESGDLGSSLCPPSLTGVNSNKFYDHLVLSLFVMYPKAQVGLLCCLRASQHPMFPRLFLLFLWYWDSYRWGCEVPMCVFPLLSSQVEVCMRGNPRKAFHLLHNAWMKEDELYFLFCKKSLLFLSLQYTWDSA